LWSLAHESQHRQVEKTESDRKNRPPVASVESPGVGLSLND
jgi:hypothetical protein